MAKSEDSAVKPEEAYAYTYAGKVVKPIQFYTQRMSSGMIPHILMRNLANGFSSAILHKWF